LKLFCALRTFLLIFIFCILPFTHFAQTRSEVDSVFSALTLLTSDTAKVRLLNDSCWKNRLINFTAARGYGAKALEIGKKINYKKGILKSLSFLGITCVNEGNHPLALQYFLEALELATEQNNFVEVAYTYNNLGKLYYNEKNATMYKQYYEKALEAARKTTDQDVLAYSLRNMAFVYEYEHQHSKALFFHKEALKIREKLQKQTYLISALLLTGNCYAQLNYYDTAFTYFNRALGIATEENTILDKADVFHAKGRAFLRMKKYDSAMVNAMSGYEIAQKQNAWEWLRISAEILYAIHNERKEYDKALNYHVIWSAYRDSILNEGQMMKINQLNLKYEFEQKERERILAEQREDVLQEEALHRQKLYLGLVVLALVAVIFITLLMFRSNLQRKKTNQALQAKNIEIEKQNTEIQKQKDAIEKQAAILAKQAEDLKAANDMKTKMFSIIGHDLRSPFATLQGALPLLEGGEFTPEETAEVLGSVKKMMNTSMDMLENLLQWARAEMQHSKPQPEEIEVRKVAQSKINLYCEIAKQKQITLVNEVQPDVKAFADLNQVFLIIRNLLGNAIKFTPVGGQITLSSKQVSNFIEVAIADNGIGMNEETRRKIFNKDSTFTTHGTAGEKGTGLGLMLCKEFTESNGGKIWVESEQGKGTTFYFTLPCVS
jgi:two-component system, sensor histidine kinase and response regulator